MSSEISGKVLFDTSVYLRILRSEVYARKHRERFARLAPRTYLCSIVAAELHAGARTIQGMRLIDGLLSPYARVGRVVFPIHADWVDQGKVLASLAIEQPAFRSKLPGLQNDVLIGLSARRIGATVLTENSRDFALIRPHVSMAFAAVGETA
ncbi:MAG: type II toxin-antitoxin system VapC family toxin [Candidatus Binatia bacterium]